eukprot:4361183-Heterocapsa_arctica.AAC.1
MSEPIVFMPRRRRSSSPARLHRSPPNSLWLNLNCHYGFHMPSTLHSFLLLGPQSRWSSPKSFSFSLELIVVVQALRNDYLDVVRQVEDAARASAHLGVQR